MISLHTTIAFAGMLQNNLYTFSVDVFRRKTTYEVEYALVGIEFRKVLSERPHSIYSIDGQLIC